MRDVSDSVYIDEATSSLSLDHEQLFHLLKLKDLFPLMSHFSSAIQGPRALGSGFPPPAFSTSNRRFWRKNQHFANQEAYG